MILIHYPTAFRALDSYIDCFNSKTSKATEKLRTGAVMTAKEIIRIYGISLLKINGFKEIDKNNMPSLQTNNHQLAKLVKCSSRTIQRNIYKLLKAGVLSRKIFHGSNSNYELFVNPELLLTKEKMSVDNIKKQYSEALELAKKNEAESNAKESQTSNCPHTYSGNTGNKINNILIGVDNSENSGFENSGNRTGNTGEIVRPFFNEKKGSGFFSDRTGEIVSRVEPPDWQVASDPARDNSLSLHVSLLWLMARNLLYREKDLTDRQVMIAKKLIQRLYEPVPTIHLSKVHQIYVQRIGLVSKYLKKDPAKRFVPLPYIYFDTKNPNGFVGTKKWYEADQIRKKEIERELILSRIIRRYVRNEKQEPVRKKPTLQLFRECENTLGKLKDSTLTQRFHAAVLHHETYKHLPYSDFSENTVNQNPKIKIC